MHYLATKEKWNTRANPTDELTRLRAELKTTMANCIAANKGAERNAWINTSLAKEVVDLRAEVERLTRERDDLRMGIEGLSLPYEALRAQLATISAERDENLKMWQHWQTEAVKAQGDLSRASKAAQTYHNAFDEAVRQRDGNREECRVMAADCLKLTAAAVVKDEALKEAQVYVVLSGAWNPNKDVLLDQIDVALSPTSSPLLADLKAAAVEISMLPLQKGGHAANALAHLRRWITSNL